MTTYTPRQIEALAWLPGDGDSASIVASKMDIGALWELCEAKLARGSGTAMRYRLTPSGIAERARLVEAGAIK